MERQNGDAIDHDGIRQARLESKLQAEEKALEAFVQQANQEIAARNGRIMLLKELLSPEDATAAMAPPTRDVVEAA